ncbi:MAG: site-2 protease family protein [Ruminococcus sp.]|nr:site-2 protease family protein [Ruminococcus sp.]
MNTYDLLQYLSRILTMLLVLPLHEAAHGFMAKKMGDDTAELQGRITLNPFAHLDPIGSLLMVFTGFGWAKPVPINPMRMRKYRAGTALTALAGPVSNLIAAFISGLIYNILICFETFADAYVEYFYMGSVTPAACLLIILQFLFSINVGLAIFNLIPLPPLDGFNVLRYFTSEKVDRWFYMHQREISYIFLIVILLITRLPYEYNFLSRITGSVCDLLWNTVNWIPQKWGVLAS